MDSLNAFNEDIDQLLGEYQKRRGAASDLQRRIREITGTASAPRQSVKVTVGVQGEVTALEFPTGAYKRMAPRELAEAVLAVIGEAKAMDAYKGLMEPHMPGGWTSWACSPATPTWPGRCRRCRRCPRPSGTTSRAAGLPRASWGAAMADPLFVDTNKINTALPGVKDIKDSVLGVWTELSDVMAAVGPCWGGTDDPTGRVFEGRYLPLSQTLSAGLVDTTKALGSMHDGIVTMSNGFHLTEVDAVDTASHLPSPSPAPAPRPRPRPRPTPEK
jgi:hypothetical protein